MSEKAQQSAFGRNVKALREDNDITQAELAYDLADVARLLGHTTPVITYQHYDRPSAEQLASIVGILGEKK